MVPKPYDPEATTPPSTEEDIADIIDLSPEELNDEAIQLLQWGENAEASRYLERSKKLAPNQFLAPMLLEQLYVDPVEHLGRDSFLYEVKPNETLSVIAERYLGHSLKFPILARYNNIEIPSSLQAGTVVRVPGDGSVAFESELEEDKRVNPEEESVEQLLGRAQIAEQDGDIQLAYDLTRQAQELAPQETNISEELFRRQSLLIGSLTDQAWELEDAGNVCGALNVWRKIDTIEPGNPATRVTIDNITKKRIKLKHDC